VHVQIAINYHNIDCKAAMRPSLSLKESTVVIQLSL